MHDNIELKPLTKDEIAELDALETRIISNYAKTKEYLGKAQSTFQLVGEDIFTAHEKFWTRHLKKTWKTWERYVRERFEISESHSYDLINKVKVLKSVDAMPERLSDDVPKGYVKTMLELADDTSLTDELDLTGLSFRAVEALGRLDIVLRKRVAQIVGRIAQRGELVSAGLIEDTVTVLTDVLDEMALEDESGDTKPLSTLIDAKVVDTGYERLMRQREAETERKRQTLLNLEKHIRPKDYSEMPHNEAQTGLVGLPIECRACQTLQEIEAAFPGGVRLTCGDVWKIIAIRGGGQVVKFTGRSEDA